MIRIPYAITLPDAVVTEVPLHDVVGSMWYYLVSGYLVHSSLQAVLRKWHAPTRRIWDDLCAFGIRLPTPHYPLEVEYYDREEDGSWLLRIVDTDGLEIRDVETLQQFVCSDARTLTELALGVIQ